MQAETRSFLKKITKKLSYGPDPGENEAYGAYGPYAAKPEEM